VATAQGDTPRTGGILTIAHFTTPANLDVHQAGTAGILFAVGPAYSGVLQFDDRSFLTFGAQNSQRTFSFS